MVYDSVKALFFGALRTPADRNLLLFFVHCFSLRGPTL